MTRGPEEAVWYGTTDEAWGLARWLWQQTGVPFTVPRLVMPVADRTTVVRADTNGMFSVPSVAYAWTSSGCSFWFVANMVARHSARGAEEYAPAADVEEFAIFARAWVARTGPDQSSGAINERAQR